MRVVKESTALGKKLLALARRNEGFTLSAVYKNYSYSKRVAYEDCLFEAIDNGDLTSFHICSHNKFSFICAWNSKDGVRYSTSQYDYLIRGATL